MASQQATGLQRGDRDVPEDSGYQDFGLSAGQLGTVDFTDSLGTVHVRWDKGQRVAQALRLEDVAARLELAPSTLSRIETGKAPVKAAYLTAMLDLFRVCDEAQRAQLTGLARDGRGKSWHGACRDLIPEGTFHYLELEAAAEYVRGFAVHAVPGFAQTGGYAEAFMEDTRPELSRAEIDGLVALQLRRQRLLRQEGRVLDLVLDESVLLRLVRSPQIMADQLEHLLTLTGEPSITVRVIRLATIRPVLCPSFTLLSLPGSADCRHRLPGGHLRTGRRQRACR